MAANVIQDRIQAPGDPQVGNLATPINSSALTKAFIQNLPIYRPGLTISRRALEIGMAHGYFLYGPFAKLGPLRDTDAAIGAGVLSTCGFLLLLKIGLSLYARSNPAAPLENLAASVPEGLGSAQSWKEFSRSFLMGGVGGAVVAGAVSFLFSLLGFFA
jgi:photosystem I subunit 11